MHDPMTVAFEIKSPFVYKTFTFADGRVFKYRRSIITIWHVDPETDGTDDSCNWSGYGKKHSNGWGPSVFDDFERLSPDAQRAVNFIWANWLSRQRPWWKHPKYHFWHWKIQVHPLQDFKRWAFSRCAGCGKRFKWGYAPVTGQWDNKGPQWFKSEKKVYHSECYAARTETWQGISDTIDNLES